jgi:hypothetical protein
VIFHDWCLSAVLEDPNKQGRLSTFLVDPSCGGNTPTVYAQCLNGGHIMLLNESSNESIVCADFTLNGTEGIYCGITCDTSRSMTNTNTTTNTTVTEYCTNVYLAVGGNSIDGPFGSIQYMCEGGYHRTSRSRFLIRL